MCDLIKAATSIILSLRHPHYTPTIPIFRRRFGSADADVIIVGAGVSGAALAYALGKVILDLSLY